MGSLQWIILAIIVMAGLAYWNHQRSDAQLKALQAAGFSLSDELAGNPKLLLSRTQKQLAVLFPDGYLRADFDQVDNLEVQHDSNSQTEFNYRLVISLQGSSRDHVEILYENEARAQATLKKLQALL